jgi:hypothetical protein
MKGITLFFSIHKRKFKLQPQSGNSITWNGDPYEAILNIDAVYEADNVRFSDLLTGSNLGGLNSENVKKYRGKVAGYCPSPTGLPNLLLNSG